MKLVPIDLGGSKQRCHVAPPPRSAPTPETLTLIRNQYAERFPDSELQIAFFHGGFPSSDLLRAAQGFDLRISLNPADLSPNLASDFRAAGGTTIELEAMTFDPHTLRTCGRPYTASKFRAIGTRLKGMGFTVGLHLVPGLPSGDTDAALKDAEEAVNCGWVDFVRIWPALGFVGSTMAEWAQNGSWVPWELRHTVTTLAQMVEIIESNNTPVIRIGIQPGQDIPVRAIAGPVHPNLRGEVECLRFGDRLEAALEGVDEGADVVVHVNSKDLAWAKGISNTNVKRCKGLYKLGSIRIHSDASVRRGAVMVQGGAHGSND